MLNMSIAVDITYSPGLHYYDFPLYVGKKWYRQINKSRVDSQNPKSTAEIKKITIDGLVVGEEEVEVNKVLLKALKIQTIIAEPEKDNTITYTKNVVWYASAVKRPVISVLEIKNTSGFSSSARTKILKYKLSE